MSDDDQNMADDIKETDILFDCPHCGKSLAIDYRGAGLNIPCSDCGQNVEVPIPEGMKLTDFDFTDKEQELQIMMLRRSLSAAEYRIEQLESEVDSLTIRRENLESDRANRMSQMTMILENIQILDRSNKETAKVLDVIEKVVREVRK